MLNKNKRQQGQFSPHYILHLIQYSSSSPSRIRHDTQRFIRRRGRRAMAAEVMDDDEMMKMKDGDDKDDEGRQ